MARFTFVAVTLALSIPATALAHESDRWYWGTDTARQVLERFVDACTPGPYCTRARSANARRIGLVPSDSHAIGGEVIFAARCFGVGPHVHASSAPLLPLFKHHRYRITIYHWWPREGERRMWVLLHVLGPSNLDRPDRPHNFLLDRLP